MSSMEERKSTTVTTFYGCGIETHLAEISKQLGIANKLKGIELQATLQRNRNYIDPELKDDLSAVIKQI